jgi:hypothetical protein
MCVQAPKLMLWVWLTTWPQPQWISSQNGSHTMQAATRSKQFVIDHRIITVAVSIVAFVVVIGGTALLITARSADHSDGAAVAADAESTTQQLHRPTDRPASMSDMTPLDTTSDSSLDHADQLTQDMLATQARQAGLTSQASDRAIWTAFPGHAGFTASDGEETVTPTRTYYPGHDGFTES